MKRPKAPENENYWKHEIKDPLKIKAYIERGTERQKRNMKLAINLKKWKDIQEKKGENNA